MIMDTRKVQRTGKSTFIVYFPKLGDEEQCPSWLDNIHHQSDNGSLLLSIDRSEQDLKIRLDIGDKSGEPLIRDITGCYVAGYRTIDIVSSHMSSAQKKDIHNIVGKLVGPEILEETINRVVMQDLLSSEELRSREPFVGSEQLSSP